MKKANQFPASERWIIAVLAFIALYYTSTHLGSQTAAALCIALLVGWTQASGSDGPTDASGAPAYGLSSIRKLIEQSSDTSVVIEELCRVSCESIGASRVTLWSVEREVGKVRLLASYPSAASLDETAPMALCDSTSALFRRIAEEGAPCAYTLPEIGGSLRACLRPTLVASSCFPSSAPPNP